MSKAKYTPAQQRIAFWNKIAITSDDNMCWEWQGYISPYGYGVYHPHTKSKGVFAHRLAWQHINGAIPDGLFVCHKCDNRACCNPKHLFLGTAKDNSEDMVNKGRSITGEKNPMRRLSWEIVRQIRAMYATNQYSQHELGRRFQVTAATINHIVHNKKWIE